MSDDLEVETENPPGITIAGSCEVNRRRYPRDAGEAAIFRTSLDRVVVVFTEENPFEGGPLILSRNDGDRQLTVKSASDLGLDPDEEKEYPYCVYDGGKKCNGCDPAGIDTPPRMIIRG